MQKFGFVVLNYGDPGLALKACSSVNKFVPGALLVLVDNASSVANRIAAEEGLAAMGLPNSYFISMVDNRGYAAGVNAGLAFLFYHTSVSLVFVLNSDVLIRQFSNFEYDAMDELLFAVRIIEGGRMSIGASRFFPWCCMRKRVHSLPVSTSTSNSNYVYVEGCIFGMTRAFFDRSFGFSEDYFLYFEELDLINKYKKICNCFPKIIYLEDIVAEHSHGGVTGMKPGVQRSAFAEYWSARSRMYFFLKWHPLTLISAIIYNVLLLIRGLICGRVDLAAAVWCGSYDAFKHWRAKVLDRFLK